MSATITKGYTFGATELVTNTKLHSLVDSASISGIAYSEVASDFYDNILVYNNAVVCYNGNLTTYS